MVVKKGGKREPFDREKLERSVRIACRKRPVEAVRMERLVSGIQRQLETQGETDVEADSIGQMVMDRSEEHTSELQSLMRSSYAVFCLKKKKIQYTNQLSH